MLPQNKIYGKTCKIRLQSCNPMYGSACGKTAEDGASRGLFSASFPPRPNTWALSL
jgi:hypothetical protein